MLKSSAEIHAGVYCLYRFLAPFEVCGKRLAPKAVPSYSQLAGPGQDLKYKKTGISSS